MKITLETQIEQEVGAELGDLSERTKTVDLVVVAEVEEVTEAHAARVRVMDPEILQPHGYRWVDLTDAQRDEISSQLSLRFAEQLHHRQIQEKFRDQAIGGLAMAIHAWEASRLPGQKIGGEAQQLWSVILAARTVVDFHARLAEYAVAKPEASNARG